MATHLSTIDHLQFEPYTFDRLRELLCELGGSRPLAREEKLHLIYFEEYFEHFLAKGRITIVVEPKYIDRDFLEDYAAYYARCFPGKYQPNCARLHFFQDNLREEGFRSAVSSNSDVLNEDRLNEIYLGFIVVRPLPHAFIGRTCLKTYDHEGRRYYPVKRHCEAHLLGFNLTVDSLPFQEQDKAAAACATSAIWSALQGTAKLFQHSIYSPVEITRIATAQFPGLRRAFPNKGLNPLQMAAAIRQAGLEPEVIGIETELGLQTTAYAYLRARIPVLLNVTLIDYSDPSAPRPFGGDWSVGHAVAITGFSIAREQPTPLPGSGTLLQATRIDKLYVHDDQLGPFARLEFGGPSGTVEFAGEKREISFSLKSSWPGEGGELGTVVFVPETLVIPVYHKIRVDFHTILEQVLSYEAEHRNKVKIDLPKAGVEWDIYLTTASEFTTDIRTCKTVHPDRRWTIVSKPFPRFLWVASAAIQGRRRLDLVFDATDVPASPGLCIDVVRHDIDPS